MSQTLGYMNGTALLSVTPSGKNASGMTSAVHKSNLTQLLGKTIAQPDSGISLSSCCNNPQIVRFARIISPRLIQKQGNVASVEATSESPSAGSATPGDVSSPIPNMGDGEASLLPCLWGCHPKERSVRADTPVAADGCPRENHSRHRKYCQ